MSSIEKFIPGTDLVAYSEGLARFAHQGQKRENGKPAITHPEEVVSLAIPAIRKTVFRSPATGAAWGHDITEDCPGFGVYNPFREHERPAEGLVYLNDLYRKAGDEGVWLCFMAHLLDKQGADSADYMQRNFCSTPNGLLEILARHAGIVKLADRVSNTDPWENIPEGKKLHIANQNLDIYLPALEGFLMHGMGRVNGHFEESKAMQDPHFDYEALRSLFHRCYVNSLQLMERYSPHHAGWLDAFGPGEIDIIKGYTPVLRGITRNEIRASL